MVRIILNNLCFGKANQYIIEIYIVISKFYLRMIGGTYGSFSS